MKYQPLPPTPLLPGIRRRFLALALTFVCASGIGPAAAQQVGLEPSKAAATQPQVPADFMPMGVYWPGEYLYGSKSGPDWQRNEQAMDDLARNGVNAVWLTHQPVSVTAEFARRAAKRGIRVVAAIAQLDGSVPHIRRGDHKGMIRGTLAGWGDAPRPIAWGLGDEPRTPYMGEMKAYVRAWRTHAPGEPVASVVMHRDVPAASRVGFDAISADIYPYFSVGNRSGYGMSAWAAWVQNARKLRQVTSRPWMMGQSYQEPAGPFEIGENGNIIYLPGGAPHWVMPTPEQISWQALAGFAEGGKGMFYFLYRWPTGPSPKRRPSGLPAAVKVRTDSGSPRGMIYPDGRPTPQYKAMGRAFLWLKRHYKTLTPLQPSTAMEAWENGRRYGNVVSILVHPKTKERYLMVVAAADPDPTVTVKITMGPHIVGLRNLEGGSSQTIGAKGNFNETSVTLPAGTAAIFSCKIDASNLPTAYADDFADDKFRKDSIKVEQVMRHGAGVLSASGGQTHERAFVIYDLEKVLPPLPKGGFRMLLYECAANPPSMRGAFWHASDDGKNFTKLSFNESGKPIFFTQRYLKVGLSFKDSNAAWAYGCLKRLDIIQWPKPAGK